jgi:hypothetical protein
VSGDYRIPAVICPVLWLCRPLSPVLADPESDADAGILDSVFGKPGDHSLWVLQGMLKYIMLRYE